MTKRHETQVFMVIVENNDETVLFVLFSNA